MNFMATVINNPDRESGSNTGLIVGIIVAIVLLFALIRWGIPAMRGDSGGANINVSVPSPSSGTNQ